MSMNNVSVPSGASSSKVWVQQEKQGDLQLSKLLGKCTAEQHKKLEESPFGKKWSEGTISGTEYVMYLADLYCIYHELERQLEFWGELKYLSPLCIKGLYREEALKKDMEYFCVPFGAAGTAANKYQRRLWKVANEKSHLLIAHVWVRYMGDLFGGQIAKKKIEQLWPQGTNFYEYEQLKADHQLSAPSRFVTPFRKILDELELTDQEKQEVSEEAVWAFEQHNKIFQELSYPSRERYVYAFAVPILINWNPLKLTQYIPDYLKVWRYLPNGTS